MKGPARATIPMTIQRDDFDVPVEDYSFSKVNDVSSLIDQMANAGGFSATKLSHARDVLAGAIQRTGQDGVLNWLSFPACLCATGTRGFFVEAIKRKAYNVIITTCGTLDHDIARTYQAYYHGAFELDDVELGEQGLNRLGNVIVPLENYGPLIEEKMQIVLENVFKNQKELSNFIRNNGFSKVEFRNLSNGISAIHSGWKI